MKIGFVLDDTLDVADGVQQYVKTLGVWLESQGHTVHYLVASSRENPNARALSRTLGLRFNKNRVRLPLPVSKRKLKKILREESYDVLHVQMPYAPWFSGNIILAAPSSTAIVGTFHVVVDSVAVAKISTALRVVYRKTRRRFNEVCAVSPAAQQYLKKSIGLEAQVIPNAVNLARFSAAKKRTELDNNKVTILFLGRLVERKGVEYLLKAFALLQDGANYRLVIVGDGPLRKKLEALVRSLNISSSVQFAGFIDEADKAGYLAAADIAVFPATGGESFGIVLIEAMAAGAGVVVGGDNPGYNSVLRSLPQTLFAPADSTELARCLELFLKDKKLSSTIHAAQAKLVKQYDVENVGKQILQMYHQAIQQIAKVT